MPYTAVALKCSWYELVLKPPWLGNSYIMNALELAFCTVKELCSYHFISSHFIWPRLNWPHFNAVTNRSHGELGRALWSDPVDRVCDQWQRTQFGWNEVSWAEVRWSEMRQEVIWTLFYRLRGSVVQAVLGGSIFTSSVISRKLKPLLLYGHRSSHSRRRQRTRYECGESSLQSIHDLRLRRLRRYSHFVAVPKLYSLNSTGPFPGSILVTSSRGCPSLRGKLLPWNLSCIRGERFVTSY